MNGLNSEGFEEHFPGDLHIGDAGDAATVDSIKSGTGVSQGRKEDFGGRTQRVQEVAQILYQRLSGRIDERSAGESSHTFCIVPYKLFSCFDFY